MLHSQLNKNNCLKCPTLVPICYLSFITKMILTLPYINRIFNNSFHLKMSKISYVYCSLNTSTHTRTFPKHVKF